MPPPKKPAASPKGDAKSAPSQGSLVPQMAKEFGITPEEIKAMLGEVSVAGPRYNEKHIYAPLKWSKAQIEDLQRQMVQAGLLDPRDITPGRFDPPTLRARSVLADYANNSGLTMTDTLGRLAAAGPPPQQGPAPRERAPFVAEPEDPMALDRVLRETMKEELGQAADDGLVERTAQKFQARLREVQRQRYNVADTGGSAAPLPNAQDYATQAVRQARPGDVASNDALGVFNQFISMLKSPI